MSGPLERHEDGSLVLDQPVERPSVLDLLIVGGGPAGTAAAFRAKELGLAALVIDYDDLMKRIRDYSKDKPILPDFGGGDRMLFPKGGKLISELPFSAIDKDEMCTIWKRLYRRHSVPAHVGVELTGLKEAEGEGWIAEAWNHNDNSEMLMQARHVLMAVGRGVPRRFDIAGNTEGIAFRLSDPVVHIGKPACVIGGGTSAAEAVIAISKAKCARNDNSPIYWSYRGEKMPKVSRALAQVFFEAFVGNGNIRYLPNSEPVSVAEHGGCEYLCVRTERKALPDSPVETTLLEFEKSHCVACIGEDLAVGLLGSLGIHLVSGGPRNRKRLVVSPLLESARPHLYLAGDLLSPAYLEAKDFQADPSSFREVKRRGNIKAALRDGVMIAEVVAQSLKGLARIHVELDFEEGPPDPKSAPAPQDESDARLVRILQGDVRGDEYPLQGDKAITIGHRECDISFPQDETLSDRHARLERSPEGFLVRDDGSRRGIFLQPAAGRSVPIPSKVVVRAGNQWLVFGDTSQLDQMIHYDSRGREIGRHRLSEGATVLGRRSCDLILDARDQSLSRRHLSVSIKSGERTLRDLESINGTHLKVDSPALLCSGDRLWMGRQTLEYVSGVRGAPEHEVIETSQASTQAAVSDLGTVEVRFANLGRSFPIRKGQTICELAEEQGLKISAQCHRGICGSDPIRVISGGEHLNPMIEGEEETLADLCSLEDGRHRLACLARPAGPVVVELITD